MVRESDARALQQVLLRETHRFIDEAADTALERLAAGSARTLYYPPGGRGGADLLDETEARVLAQVVSSDLVRGALRKVLREAASSPLFHLFALIDGVADPADWSGDVWLGAELRPPEGDRDRDMLHDGFYDSYWAAHCDR